jgi:RNA polymerase sigma-70 factor (family 1)
VSYADFTDDILARLLRTSDEQAFQEIYQRHWQRLYRLALRKTSNTTTAEEIVQEIFLTLWDKRETLLIEKLEAYLVSSAKYAVIQHLKSRLTSPQTLEIAHEQTAERQATEERLLLNDLRTALETGLATLPSKTETVFRMSRFEQLSHTEIATQLDLSEKSVEYHITVALRLLRISLREFLG